MRSGLFSKTGQGVEQEVDVGSRGVQVGSDADEPVTHADVDSSRG